MLIYITLLYGMFKRKRWALYLGLVIFVLVTIASIMSAGIYFPMYIIILVLLYWHKDYLNQ
ncbi:hypothetical protein CMO94_00230 [Candidatus Woesearchaeota archaeon]|nr:hypothetical protein [Candidatus Woesearchaeota archaeon]